MLKIITKAAPTAKNAVFFIELAVIKLAKHKITINTIKNIFSSAKAALNSDATETNTVFPVFHSPLMNERIVLVKTIQRRIIKLPLQPFDVPNIPPR